MVVVAACVVVVLVLRPVMMLPIVVLVRVGCVLCRWQQNPVITAAQAHVGRAAHARRHGACPHWPCPLRMVAGHDNYIVIIRPTGSWRVRPAAHAVPIPVMVVSASVLFRPCLHSLNQSAVISMWLIGPEQVCAAWRIMHAAGSWCMPSSFAVA